MMKIELERVRRALDRFKCYDEEMDFEGVSHDSLRKCALCGCDVEVYDNTNFAAFCTNLNCERSLAGSYSPCWRTNIVKAVNDWNALVETAREVSNG